MKKYLFRVWTALVLILIAFSALSCEASVGDETEQTAVLTYSGVSDGQIELMTAEGEILRFSYSYSKLHHTPQYPFPCYTAVGSVMKLADISVGQRMTIRYTGGDLVRIFAKKQYKKIREMRQIELPEGATREFGVVKEVGEDRLLVYLGRCDDIADIDPADCTYVPIRHVPVVSADLFSAEEQEIRLEVGTYVRIFHSGEIAEGALRDVYSVAVCMNVITQQFRVCELRGSDILLRSAENLMMLGHGIFESGQVFEDGQPVSLDSIRIGDVIEIEWDGTVLTTFPGQFGSVYAARVVARTDTAEYLGVIKEVRGDHLLVYFSGADRANPRDLVNDVLVYQNSDCVRVPLAGVTLVSGTDPDATVSVNDLAGGDRVWVSYTGDGFENAPNEECAVSRIMWYEAWGILLTVTEIREQHVIMTDAVGRTFSFAKNDAAHDYQLYEKGEVISFDTLMVGDRVYVNCCGEVYQFAGDGGYHFPYVFAVRVVERAK